MSRVVLALLTTLIVLLTSCDSSVVFEENKPIEKAVWKAEAPVLFEFETKDTTTLHNFYINMRNGENYPYSNIFFFVETEFPNGKKSVDTVECFVADNTGKWIGTGSGDIHDNRFLYQHGKQFPIAGRYRIAVKQGMRVAELEGVYDIGFRLSRTNK